MSQHYPRPEEVAVPEDTPVWPSTKLLRYIERDGLIVPILVHKIQDDFLKSQGYQFIAADKFHGERVLACLELDFTTVLVETEWTEDDL